MSEYTQTRRILFPARQKNRAGRAIAAEIRPTCDERLKSAIVYDNYMTDHSPADLRGRYEMKEKTRVYEA
ncbi:hypothetical protein ACE04B_32655, partial [Rhizobium phaseoli]